MADTPLKLLFSPIKVGKITLRNRIVLLPHTNNFPVQELPGEMEVYYFAERAKGGLALIIYGSQYVHSLAGYAVNAGSPKVVERYKRITEAVHQHGAHIFCQLMHRGSGHTVSEIGLNWRQPYGASSQPDEGTVTREMTHDDIQRALEAYVVAAQHAREGGFDGIEVRLNSGLTQEFTSKLRNRRTDDYGGSLENRLRFPLQVIDAVHQEVGSALTLDTRVCADEVLPGGYGVEEGQEIARIVAGTRKIAFINTAIGWGEGAVGSIYVQGPYPLPQAYAVYASEALKRVVDIPVVGQGRINEPQLAEQVLQEGRADLIGVTRSLIADPEFPNKAKEGRFDDIRKCIGYHEVCQGRNSRKIPISCVWNPAAGREKELGADTLKPATVEKKVMVIGGGPAGLKVAEVAARRGHRVTLYDKDNELGGQINLAIRLPFRDHLDEIPRFLALQLGKLGVEVHKGVDVTSDMALMSGADTVVVATGSVPYIPSIPGAKGKNVVTYWDAARDRGVDGNTILVYDQQGFWPAAGIAELLLTQGKKVVIVTTQSSIGARIQPQTLAMWNQRIDGKPLTRLTDASVVGISGSTVTLSSTYGTDHQWTIKGIDKVVLACGGTPNDSLYQALNGKVKDMRLVGDCEAPFPIERGIYAAELLGRAI